MHVPIPGRSGSRATVSTLLPSDKEWLTGKYRARLLLEGDRDDGEKTEDLTAAFRREFRASLLVASCKGLADMPPPPPGTRRTLRLLLSAM